MITPGQSQALFQVEQICAANRNAVEIVAIQQNGDAAQLSFDISVKIGPVPKGTGGVRFKDRERFHIRIPAEFPFEKPSVWVRHERFAGVPHVQWKRYLCLYQAATEWNPSDGMYGLFSRLWHWIERAALGGMEIAGEPLHPPAVYRSGASQVVVVPRVDTPAFSGDLWVGLAGLQPIGARLEIVEWKEPTQPLLAPAFAIAILLGKAFPWEYPTTFAGVFVEAAKCGVSRELLLTLLKIATSVGNVDDPVYFILGSPLRGIVGGEAKQHLSVWRIGSPWIERIRLAEKRESDHGELAQAREAFAQTLWELLELSEVEWCRIMEERPEIVVRRDTNSPMAYFKDKSVALWGCGALGGNIAHLLCRAGVRRLALYDNGLVNPGLLVRQPYRRADIGRRKVEALAEDLLEVRLELEVQSHAVDLSTLLLRDPDATTDDVDVVIDATASSSVQQALERGWSARTRKIPVASLILDGTASSSLSVLCSGEGSGGPWDRYRKLKLNICRSANMRTLAERFYPLDGGRIFQPEPGCSEPTFIGSAADSAALAALGLNQVASELWGTTGVSFGNTFTQTARRTSKTESDVSCEFAPDLVTRGAEMEVRIASEAFGLMRRWIADNRKRRGKKVETGGLLWGEWDDAVGIIWVTSVSGPPSDSRFSAEEFLCGTKGTVAAHNLWQKRSRGAAGYIGMWHTHPVSTPLPSATDFRGMSQILTRGKLPPRRNLLIIIGKGSDRRDYIGIYPFRRPGFEVGLPSVVAKGTLSLLPIPLF
jgi:integrative and conjugative element protein (TIGR02256 family)